MIDVNRLGMWFTALAFLGICVAGAWLLRPKRLRRKYGLKLVRVIIHIPHTLISISGGRMQVTFGTKEYVTVNLSPLGPDNEAEPVENLTLVSSDETVAKVVTPSKDSPLDPNSFDIVPVGPGTCVCSPKADALVGEGEQIIVGEEVDVTILKTLATHIGVTVSAPKPITP